MKHIETEFKWNANFPRAFYKMQRACQEIAALSDGQKIKIHDTYLDTPNGFFNRQKIAFRLRYVDHRWEATFKTKTELKNGCAVRREETLKLPVKTLSEALRFLQQKRIWEGLPLTELQPKFSIKNNRTLYTVSYQKTYGELAFDSFKIFVCGRTVCMKEIELELKKGSPQILAKLAKQITQTSALKFAKISKVKTAEKLLQLWK